MVLHQSDLVSSQSTPVGASLDSFDESRFDDTLTSFSSSMLPDPVLPEIGWEDVRVGQVLGKGTFSKVKKVTFRSNLGKQDTKKYSIKFLRNSTRDNSKVLATAAVDLAIEGQLLSYLEHENIIKIHAQGCTSDAYAQRECPHFLILDRLYTTLNKKLDDWRFFQNGDDMVPIMFANKERTTPLQRIHNVALPIARALEYLHSERIVYRDLKPFNVGYSSRGGTIKLFDFGLARIIKDDGRRMTARVGSPLYMAPEIVQGRKDYGLPVDVYAFSLVLWELLTLNVPFEGMDRAMLEKRVTRERLRPAVDKDCGSVRMQELLKSAWSHSAKRRPAFSTICKVLEEDYC